MNLQLYQDLKYKALAQLTQSEALAQGDLRKALPEILQLTAEALQVERINIWEIAQDTPCTLIRIGNYFLSKHLFDDTSERIPLAVNYFQTLTTERMLVIDDTATNPLVQDLRESYLLPFRIGAMIDTMISDNGTPIGVLCCEHVGPARVWEIEERLFLMSIANLVALAIGTRERRKALRKVAVNQARLRSLIENTDNAIWMLDTKQKLLTFNEQFSAICKTYYQKVPVEGMDILSLTDIPEEQEKWLSRYQKALQGEFFRYTENFVIENKQYVFETSTFPVYEKNVIIGVSSFSKNITHIIRTQRSLEEKNEELIRINKEMDEFVYRTSHDLRSPLTSILGLISLIENESDLDKVHQMLALMRRSVQRLDTSIQDILNLSVNSRTVVASQPIDWQELIMDIWEDLCFATGEHAISCSVDNQLPAAFLSDPRRLQMVMNNLLSNAIRYHRADEPSPFVRVSIVPVGNNIEVVCSDNGQGIAPEYVDRIFEMFFRANTTKSGSGLGLYIVSEALHKLGGTIRVASTLGQGTTFTITLPIR